MRLSLMRWNMGFHQLAVGREGESEVNKLKGQWQVCILTLAAFPVSAHIGHLKVHVIGPFPLLNTIRMSRL
jgi:hypothetical protein